MASVPAMEKIGSPPFGEQAFRSPIPLVSCCIADSQRRDRAEDRPEPRLARRSMSYPQILTILTTFHI